jgi:hypothetical protein
MAAIFRKRIYNREGYVRMQRHNVTARIGTIAVLSALVFTIGIMWSGTGIASVGSDTESFAQNGNGNNSQGNGNQGDGNNG